MSRHSPAPLAASATAGTAPNPAGQPKQRVALVLPNLRIGGAQRVVVLLAEQFAAKGFEVDLVLAQDTGDLRSGLSPRIRVVPLGAERLRGALLPLVRYLRRERPAALLSGLWPLTTITVLAAGLARYRGRTVLCEHSTLSLSPAGRGWRRWLLSACLRWINSRADTLVGVSDGVVADLAELGAAPDRLRRIYNPVALAGGASMPDAAPPGWLAAPLRHRLLAVGRLKPAKDYPTMLRAVARVRARGEPVQLAILGDGPELGALQRLAAELGIVDAVSFVGDVTDPERYYSRAGMFVISSVFEGFGNVLVEAMLHGLPIVATACRSGPAEILAGGRFGRLVAPADADALAAAIVESLASTPDARALQARAADFTPERIAEEYLDVLGIAASPGRGTTT